jgi:ABC-type multidrug transport system fused ATPase/permease subunit
LVHKKIASLLLFCTTWTKYETKKRCHNGTDDSFKFKIDGSNKQLID